VRWRINGRRVVLVVTRAGNRPFPMHLTPISPFLGVECLDKLSFPLSPGARLAVRDAVNLHGVVVFRDQNIGDHEQIELAEVLGEVALEPATSYAPGSTQITTFEHRRQAGYVTSETFHSDGMFDVPVTGLCLRVIEHPTSGGDTIFCSYRRAWESLSPGVRDLLKGLSVRYSALPPVAARKYIRTSVPPVDMPLVFRHPITGEDSLWFSPMGARDIPELAAEEVPMIFALLNEHINRFQNQIRVKHTPGTVVLFDNTAVCHAVAIDYLPEVRKASRVVIQGKPLQRAAPSLGGVELGFVK
jgi:taurine dioxygenase